MNKLLLLFALYACGASETPVPQGSSTAKSKPRETQSAETTAPAARVQPERNTGGRVLVVYFSRTGENYNVGTINEGNTAIVGGMIAACIGADVFEMLALFAAHHVGNRKWYCTLPKGKYTASRVFRTAFDALLLILMVVQPMSVHAGTHLFALCVDLWKKKPRIAVFAVTAALSAYGVYAFVKRGFP